MTTLRWPQRSDRRRLPVLPAGPGRIFAFIFLVLALSWLRLLPAPIEQATGLATPGIVVDVMLPLLGTFAPLWAALIVTSRLTGGPGARRLLAQITRWRTGAGWYAAALLGPVGLFGAALGLAVLLGASPPRFGAGEAGGALAILAAALVFVTGEEYGWRGFLLPALQARWPALAAALMVGCVWAAWHAPLFLDPEAVQADVPPPAFLALGVGLSVLMAWLYNSTGGSLLIVVIAHAAMNASLGAIAINLPDTDSLALYVWICAAAVWLAALALVTLDLNERRRPPALSDR